MYSLLRICDRILLLLRTSLLTIQFKIHFICYFSKIWPIIGLFLWKYNLVSKTYLKSPNRRKSHILVCFWVEILILSWFYRHELWWNYITLDINVLTKQFLKMVFYLKIKGKKYIFGRCWDIFIRHDGYTNCEYRKICNIRHLIWND